MDATPTKTSGISGSNTLTLNQETMRRVVQYYLDNVLFKSNDNTVTGITSTSGLDKTFVVQMSNTD